MVKALRPAQVIPMHGTKAEYDKLGALLAQQVPDVQYLPPQATSSIVVSEMSDTGLVALLVCVTTLSCALMMKRRE
jgi:hypothetical protein